MNITNLLGPARPLSIDPKQPTERVTKPLLVRIAARKHFDCMVAARLSSIREMRGMTQADVAKLSGLKPAAVSHFETARRRPCLANLMRLCAALRCTPNDILCQ